MLYAILFLALLFQALPSLHAEEERSLATRIKELSEKSLPYEEEEWDNDEVYSEFLSQVLKNQLTPTEMRKHNVVFKLVGTDPIFNDSIVREETTWQDLNFFAGKKQTDPCIGSKLDQTLTGLGKAQLYTMLGASVNNIATIEQQQAKIKLFLDKPKLREQARQTLAKFAEIENIMLSFWSRDPFLGRIKKHYDFQDVILHYFNRNNNALMLKHVYKTSKTFLNFFTDIVGCSALTMYTLSQLLPDRDNNPLEIRHLAAEHKSRNILIKFLWDKDIRPFNIAIASAGAYYLYTSFNDHLEWICDVAMYDEILHYKIQQVRAAWTCFEELVPLLTPELCSLMPEADAIKNLVSLPGATDDSFTALINLLQEDTFAKDASGLLAHRGNVMLAYKLMHSQKDNFIAALRAISSIDCYSSLAMLMHKEKGTFCFAQLEQAHAPHIYLEDFINPLVPADKAIGNTLELGGNGASRNCIITGPNAGGKSTLVKAVGINVLMAQSFGIAAAKSCTLTPFSFVATYLNITDDINAGNSLFKAEVLRTHKLITTMKALPQGQRGLLIFDEIFNGTTTTEGSAAAYAVAKHLGAFANGITIVATHFEQLTKLEALPQCSYKNYKVSVTINKDSSLTYPFKIESGISKQHIAIDVLRSEGYETDILREAEELLRS